MKCVLVKREREEEEKKTDKKKEGKCKASITNMINGSMSNLLLTFYTFSVLEKKEKIFFHFISMLLYESHTNEYF